MLIYIQFGIKLLRIFNISNQKLTNELKNFNHNKLETLEGKLEVIDLSVWCQSVI